MVGNRFFKRPVNLLIRWQGLMDGLAALGFQAEDA